jgi:uncharacterized protein (TIGR03083 family)
MSNSLDALASSVDHLRSILEASNESQFVASAYPSEWTVADVMSHLGSGAIIFKRGIDDSLDARETPPQFNQSVWDLWDAKTPHAKVTDSLDADKALLARLVEMTADEREGFTLNLGPMTFDFDHVVQLRLNEHIMHTWDIEEAFDHRATLQAEGVPFVIDNLQLLMRYSAKATEHEHTLHVRTTNPDRTFALSQSADGVTFNEVEGVELFDLDIPAEAFVRLAYGRLDETHTPKGIDPTHLDELRRVFAGV